MSSRKFTAQTFAWLRLLKGDRDTTALAVGVQLVTEHFNEKDHGGRAWPGTAYMAKELGLSQSTVVRAIHRMHQRDRLRVIWGKQGRRHSNQYWMIVKDAPAHLLDLEKDASVSAVKDAPAPVKDAPAHMNLLKTTAPFGRVVCVAKIERAPEGALDGVEGVEEETVVEVIDVADVAAQELEAQFAQLCELWQKPDGIDRRKALKAFEAVCSEYDGEEVLASAAAWVRTVEPRYLKKLELWLAHGAWLEKPVDRRFNGHRKETAVEVAMRLSMTSRNGGHA